MLADIFLVERWGMKTIEQMLKNILAFRAHDSKTGHPKLNPKTTGILFQHQSCALHSQWLP